MAILVELKRKTDKSIINTIFSNINSKADDYVEYTRAMIIQLLGGKISDMALSDGFLIFSSETIDSINIDGKSHDVDYLWNQAVSIVFNQPFYGNVFIALIDDLDETFIKDLESEFILNSYNELNLIPGFINDLKSGMMPDERNDFYNDKINDMIEEFQKFMEAIKKKAEELFSPEELEKLHDVNDSSENYTDEYVNVLFYDHDTGGDDFFKDIEEINENCHYIIYKQLSKIPLSDIKEILKNKSVVNLELNSNSKNKKYHIDIKGDKKVLDEFAEILLKHFELTEDYEFCVVLKNIQNEIK